MSASGRLASISRESSGISGIGGMTGTGYSRELLSIGRTVNLSGSSSRRRNRSGGSNPGTPTLRSMYTGGDSSVSPGPLSPADLASFVLKDDDSHNVESLEHAQGEGPGEHHPFSVGGEGRLPGGYQSDDEDNRRTSRPSMDNPAARGAFRPVRKGGHGQRRGSGHRHRHSIRGNSPERSDESKSSSSSLPSDQRYKIIAGMDRIERRRREESWSPKQEYLFKSWARKAQGLAYLHGKSGRQHRRRHNMMSIPTIVLTGIAGVGGFATIKRQAPSDTDIIMHYVFAVLNITGATLASLLKVFDSATMESRHFTAVRAYTKLSRFIAMQLSLEPKDREECITVLRRVLDEYDTLQNDSPDVPAHIIEISRPAFADVPVEYTPDVMCLPMDLANGKRAKTNGRNLFSLMRQATRSNPQPRRTPRLGIALRPRNSRDGDGLDMDGSNDPSVSKWRNSDDSSPDTPFSPPV